jgi:isoleucyl-tRNA synthetase
MEESILRFWKEHDVFRKSVEQRPEDRLYTFYEGPPTANVGPGLHHVLSRAFKDLFPRYKTMRGYRVPRKAGWDTHGLPVELEVERQLGLKSKPEIEEFGIEEFNRRCRESVFRYVKEWETLTERIGFWVDMEGAYITYEDKYIESVWWIVKQLWDNDLLYLDYRSTPHCPRCGTSLSDGEVALGYRENTPDPSIYIKFRLTEASRAKLADKVPGDLPLSLLAWTTTPWTLPGNTALAVQRYADYAVAEVDGEGLILAAALVDTVLDGDHKVVANLTGDDIADLKYEPLYDPTTWGVQAMWFDPEQDRRLVATDDPRQVERAYVVITGDFVSMDDGTGIVHVAPAFGADDFQIGKELGLLFMQPVDLRGRLPERCPWPGEFVKDADTAIMEELTGRGALVRQETIRHTYPFCWRCDTPLLYYAKPTWYIRTSAVKDSLMDGNEKVNWYPEHIKRGRFGDWLRNNVDWALSRERYWGTPLPVWRCAACDAQECVGSRDQLRERAVDPSVVDALEDLHRPHVDRVELACGNCGSSMHRAPEVLDCWFDSGAMPYAQWHYPFENADTFERSFPADYICEAVDQTRGWFYTLHAESVLLNSIGAVAENLCFRNVICLGLILDDKGRKMSSSRGNVVEPMSVVNAQGADALRWYLYTATRPGEARRFSQKLVQETLRRFLLTLRNTYSFFVTYANLDEFDPTTAPQGEPSELDRWVLSELNVLVRRVTDRLDQYDPTTSGRAIQAFTEDLSNWYVRRSRRRFWKSGADSEKLAAYHTLYACLVTLTKLMAPFTPFVAEDMYQNLVRSVDGDEPESVHLAQWPEANDSAVDQRLMDETRTVMRAVSLGRAARSKAGIKVRQPLARVVVKPRAPAEAEGLRRLEGQVLEELNVKALAVVDKDVDLEGLATAADEGGYSVGLDTEITPDLADEGLARELVHRVQNLRKAAREVLDRHGDYVRQETLSEELVEGPPPEDAHGEEQKIDGQMVRLAVRRTG